MISSNNLRQVHNKNKAGISLLNLGCGSHYHPEWTNINFPATSKEVSGHDLLKGIPFPDSSFDVVYHSHLLEHFTRDESVYFLGECRRVLKQIGIVRVAVPDLETILQNYFIYLPEALAGNPSGACRYHWTLLELFDQMVREKRGGGIKKFLEMANDEGRQFIRARMGQEAEDFWEAPAQKANRSISKRLRSKSLREIIRLIRRRVNRATIRLLAGREGQKAYDLGLFRLTGEVHYWMYDRYSLGELLRQAGFQEVKVCNAFESSIPNFGKYELDVVNGAVRKPDSLFMEGIKK